MAVVRQLANNRQGTQKAKTRSEVSPAAEENRGDRKEQVMQDRVQQRSPQWTGGGVVFAPVPRDYSIQNEQKRKKTGSEIRTLTSRVQENKLIVLEDLNIRREQKQKQCQTVLNNLNVSKALVVLNEENTNVVFIYKKYSGCCRQHTQIQSTYLIS